MPKIFLDCTNYIKNLVDKKELDDECLMYKKYIVCFSGNENDIAEIYRIQTGFDENYEPTDNSTIVEYQRINLRKILQAQEIHSCTENVMWLTCSTTRNALTLRDIIKFVIKFDETDGFETWRITEYKKSLCIDTILDDIRCDAPILIF